MKKLKSWRKFNEETTSPEVKPAIAPSRPKPVRPNPFKKNMPVTTPKPKAELDDVLSKLSKLADDDFKKQLISRYGKNK